MCSFRKKQNKNVQYFILEMWRTLKPRCDFIFKEI